MWKGDVQDREAKARKTETSKLQIVDFQRLMDGVFSEVAEQMEKKEVGIDDGSKVG